MDELFALLYRVISSVLLVRYYACFLRPKSGKLPQFAALFCFGTAYFAVHSLGALILARFSGYDTITNALMALCVSAVLMAAVYLLTRVFFMNNTNMSIFLLFSFFSTQEICFRISLGLFGSSMFSDDRLVFGIFLMLLHTALFYFSLRSIMKSFTHKDRVFALSELFYLILPCISGLALISIISLIPYRKDEAGNIALYAEIPFADLLILLTV